MHEISIRGLTKSFGRNTVLSDVNLEIAEGEFIGLMGPNGAGKSTLLKILDGVYQATSGEVLYAGDRVPSLGSLPHVGFVHQDLGLVDELTIVDNLRLGQPPIRRAGPITHRRLERERAEAALARVRLARHPDTPIGDLAPGEKALVAVARLLDRGARVLVLDETTSTLPPSDSRRLIEILKAMVAAEDATVIMVSHKLSEVLNSAERVILLLDGRVAADVGAAGLDREQLVGMLASHEMESHLETTAAPVSSGPELLRLDAVCGAEIGPLDLTLTSGTVTGITGLAGSGLHDVAYLAHGAEEPTSGSVRRPAGVGSALVPPHRETQGGFRELTVLENLTITSLRRWSRGSLVKRAEERVDGSAITRRMRVKPPLLDAPFSSLSGGNKQKVIFGRALLAEPEVYVLCEPTRGVDVETRREIYQCIRELAAAGSAVLVVTSDSEDLFAVCDRCAVVADGRIGELIDVDNTNPAELEALL